MDELLARAAVLLILLTRAEKKKKKRAMKARQVKEGKREGEKSDDSPSVALLSLFLSLSQNKRGKKLTASESRSR